MHSICFKLEAMQIVFTDAVKLTALLHELLTSLHAQCQQGHGNVSAWTSSAVCERQWAETCMHSICFKLEAMQIVFTDAVKLTALLHELLTSLHAQCQQGHGNVSAWTSSAVCERQWAETCMHSICFKLEAMQIVFTDAVKLTALLHELLTSLHAQCQQGHGNVSAWTSSAVCERQWAETCMHSICFKLEAMQIVFTDAVKLTALLHELLTSLHAQCQQGHGNVSAWTSSAVCERQWAETCMHSICFKLEAMQIVFTDAVKLTALLHELLTSLHAQCQQGHGNVSAWTSSAVCERQWAETCMHSICFKLEAMQIVFTDAVKLLALLHELLTSLHAQCQQGHGNVSAWTSSAVCERQWAETCMHSICFKLEAMQIVFTDAVKLTALLHELLTSLHAQCQQGHGNVSAWTSSAVCERQWAETCMHSICFKLEAMQIVFNDAVKHTALLHELLTSLHAQCQQSHSNVPADMISAVCERQWGETCMHTICFKLEAMQIVFTDAVKHTALLHELLTSLHAQCQQSDSNVPADMISAVCERQWAETCMHTICFKLEAMQIVFTDAVKLTALLHELLTSLHAQCQQKSFLFETQFVLQ